MFILSFVIFFQDMLVKSLLELFPTWPQPSSVKCLKWKFSQVKNLIMSYPTWEQPGSVKCLQWKFSQVKNLSGSFFQTKSF